MAIFRAWRGIRHPKSRAKIATTARRSAGPMGFNLTLRASVCFSVPPTFCRLRKICCPNTRATPTIGSTRVWHRKKTRRPQPSRWAMTMGAALRGRRGARCLPIGKTRRPMRGFGGIGAAPITPLPMVTSNGWRPKMLALRARVSRLNYARLFLALFRSRPNANGGLLLLCRARLARTATRARLFRLCFSGDRRRETRQTEAAQTVVASNSDTIRAAKRSISCFPCLLPPEKMHNRVLMAMSGGVDSSVAAALLVEQNYEVIGVTMKLWAGEDDPFAAHRFGGCCTVGSSEDARRVAHQLDIPYYVLNLQDEFNERVVDNFVAEYAAGRTPNPCARCNEFIKFRAFIERADELDCAFIATGHYARLEKGEDDGRAHLRRGLDARKDQSYVLGMLTQSELQRVLLPIGAMEKPLVRERAATAWEWAWPTSPIRRRFVLSKTAITRNSSSIAPRKWRRPARFSTKAAKSWASIAVWRTTPSGSAKVWASQQQTPLFVNRIDAERNAVIVGPRATLNRRRSALRGRDLDLGRSRPKAPNWKRKRARTRSAFPGTLGARRPRTVSPCEISTNHVERRDAGTVVRALRRR